MLGSTNDRAGSLCQHETRLGPAPIELASTRQRASSLCQHEKPSGSASIEVASTEARPNFRAGSTGWLHVAANEKSNDLPVDELASHELTCVSIVPYASPND